MKKIFKNFIILFIFCLTFTFGGFFNTLTASAEFSTTTGKPVPISSAEELKAYINTYGVMGANNGAPTDNIVLKGDINMSGIELVKTIGTAEKPFVGTFEGNGFKIENLHVVKNLAIGDDSLPSANQYNGLFGYVGDGAVIRNFTVSNMTIDATANLTGYSSSVNNQFAGLVGYAKKATFERISFTGTSKIVSGGYQIVDEENVSVLGASNIFAGILAGKLDGATVNMVQNNSTMTFNPTFESNINFGSLVGIASDSKISYVNSKNDTAFGNWQMAGTVGKVFNLGGLAGVLSNTQVKFTVLTERFNLAIASDFVGDVNFGGIAGVINQGNTQIFNVATENRYSIVNNAVSSATVVNIGEIAGKIGTPVPQAGNLSYIHYADNSLSRFGDIGSYVYADEEDHDYIKASPNYILNALESNNKIPNYFANQTWHPLYGDWDFNSIWYVGGQSIKLQSFYGNFNVSYLDNSDVLSMTTQDFVTAYQYGDNVAMDFEFKKTDGDVPFSEFYTLSAVNLGNAKVATITQSETESGTVYAISDCDFIKINATETGFQLVVENVSLATAGQYTVSTEAKIFKATAGSLLFKESSDGQSEELVDGTTPGYVYYAEGANTTSTSVSLENMAYGRSFRLRTREIPNSPYLFQSWILTDEEGESYDIGSNKVLEINFGTGLFVGNFTLTAKYLDNAQVISFIIDDGISRIELNSGAVTIDESGQSSSVSKSNDAFKMDIYVKEGYEFNVENFVKTLNTYKSVDASEAFCTLSSDGSDTTKYSFILNMTVLNKDDFGETFEIKAQTTQQEKENNTWIWIVVGVGGGLLLIGLIILIIVLVRRNRFGGGSSGSFKSYKKGMYY